MLVAANRGIVFGLVTRWLLHELRTPAQALSLAGELIARNGAAITEPIRQSLAVHARQIRPLLDFCSRAQRPPVDDEPAPTPLAEIVELIVAAHRGRPSSAALDLTGIAPQLPAVRANAAALTHALLNIVLNALEALGDRPDGVIRLSAGARDGVVAITVEDNGPGVAAVMRDRLFEPFATTKPAAVAGLGLAVARHIIEPWGGSLKNETGAHGARFVITLDVWRSISPERLAGDSASSRSLS